jgi:hypothetical protein
MARNVTDYLFDTTITSPFQEEEQVAAAAPAVIEYPVTSDAGMQYPAGGVEYPAVVEAMTDYPLSSLFGPLPKSYCYLFYFFSIAGLVLFFMSIVMFVFMVFNRSKLSILLPSFSLIILYFIMYIQNRLFFNMCK